MSGVQLQNKYKSRPLDLSAKFDNYKVTALIHGVVNQRNDSNKCQN